MKNWVLIELEGHLRRLQAILTEPRGALQPKGPQWFPRIGLFVLIFCTSQSFFLAKSLQKTCFILHEKLQRNPFFRSGSKFFIFRLYGFDYFGFLTNAWRGAMRSKTQWVFYRDLDWQPGPQKVTGYPKVRALLGSVKPTNSSFFLHKLAAISWLSPMSGQLRIL